MTQSVKYEITETSDQGMILQCYDSEVADQFDDFLIEILDEEVHLAFSENKVTFYFGTKFSISEIDSLFETFRNKIL
jgi:hypothetical protein